MNESVNNYFDALNQFLDTWLKVFEKTMGNQKGGLFDDKSAEKFTNNMHDFLGKLQKAANQQQDMLNNMTPEQYQEQALKSLQAFEKAFDDTTQKVKASLQKEEQYVSSDQFVADVKDNAQKSQNFFNALIEGLTGMINNYTKSLERTVS